MSVVELCRELQQVSSIVPFPFFCKRNILSINLILIDVITKGLSILMPQAKNFITILCHVQRDYAKTKKQGIKIMSFFFIFPRAEKELYGSTTKSFWRECLDMVLELPSAEAEIIHISPMVTLVLLFRTSSNPAQLRGNYCKN